MGYRAVRQELALQQAGLGQILIPDGALVFTGQSDPGPVDLGNHRDLLPVVGSLPTVGGIVGHVVVEPLLNQFALRLVDFSFLLAVIPGCNLAVHSFVGCSHSMKVQLINSTSQQHGWNSHRINVRFRHDPSASSGSGSPLSKLTNGLVPASLK